MAEKIEIDAGEGQYIKGVYRCPNELLTPEIDETLVIMSHGFPGNRTGYNDLFGDIEFLLADKGFHTLRFDYRGCGESNGRDLDYTIGGACEDFQNVLYWAKSRGYKRFSYIGEGLGATLAVMNHDLDVVCGVALWPAFNLQEYKQHAIGLEGDPSDEQKSQGFVDVDGIRAGLSLLDELEKIDITYALREVRVPYLIMHGVRDDKIPVACLDLARAHMRSKRIEITTFHDGSHGLTQMNHRKTMFYHIQQFIEKYI